MTPIKSWELPLVGFAVFDVWFSGRISIVAYKTQRKGDFNAPKATLSFGGPFSFRDRDGVIHDLDAGGDWGSLTPLFELRHRFIDSATADDSSRIEVRLDLGYVLSAGPDPQYENWELSGPGDLNLVAPPGGGDPRISGGL